MDEDLNKLVYDRDSAWAAIRRGVGSLSGTRSSVARGPRELALAGILADATGGGTPAIRKVTKEPIEYGGRESKISG